MEEVKKPLDCLFVDNPETPEGKYLVKRRDGTVVEWPHFVLGAKDPVAIGALEWYGKEVLRIVCEEPDLAKFLGLTQKFGESVLSQIVKWQHYMAKHGKGDPGMGRHRKDDPGTIAEMRKGHSA